MRVLRGIKNPDFMFYLFEHNDYVRNRLIDHAYASGHIIDTLISLVEIEEEVPKDKDGNPLDKNYILYHHTYDLDIVTEDHQRLSISCSVSASDGPFLFTYSIGPLPSIQGIEDYTRRVLICDKYVVHDTDEPIFCAKVIKQYYDPIQECYKYNIVNNYIVQLGYFNDQNIVDNESEVIYQLAYLLKYSMKYDDNEIVNSILDSYDEYLNMEDVVC